MLKKRQKTKRYKDVKILRLEYTSVALRSHSRSVIAGVPKEVSKTKLKTKDRPLRRNVRQKTRCALGLSKVYELRVTICGIFASKL